MVEIDCLLAVRALEEDALSYDRYSSLLQEILWLKSLFVTYNFGYVSRLGNQVAHSLARYAWQVETTMIWWEWDMVPDFSLYVLRLDAELLSL